MSLKAGRAGEFNAQDVFELAARAGAARLGGAEERDDRFAGRGGLRCGKVISPSPQAKDLKYSAVCACVE
jgi:hypothetical protein